MFNVMDYLNKLIPTNINASEFNSTNGNWTPITVPFCLRVQTYSINNAVVIWDLILLVPNILFVLFLLTKWIRVRVKLRSIRFPILTVFFNLILLISLLSIMRCLVTILIKPVNPTAEVINKIVWLVVRFSQLSTELSVVFFGLFFARLDSNKSILRIMYLTIPISLVYVLIQGCLEMIWPDTHYIVIDNQSRYFDLYGHGGMIFWFVSSTIFAFIYTTVFFLPFTKFREIFPIPTKKSFYVYCLVLAIVCLVQSAGAVFVYINIDNNGYGLCLLDLTTFLYFTLFGPLVYIVFLRKFFQKEAIFPSSYVIKDGDSSFSSSINHDGSLSPNLGNTNINYGFGNEEDNIGVGVAILEGKRSGAKPRSGPVLAEAWLKSSSSPPQDSFESIHNHSQPPSTSNYTTSVLMSARESLNELRSSRILEEASPGSLGDDDLFVDDDDTKVIIIKNPSYK